MDSEAFSIVVFLNGRDGRSDLEFTSVLQLDDMVQASLFRTVYRLANIPRLIGSSLRADQFSDECSRKTPQSEGALASFTE